MAMAHSGIVTDMVRLILLKTFGNMYKKFLQFKDVLPVFFCYFNGSFHCFRLVFALR